MADDISVTEIDPVRRQVLRGGVAAAAVAGVSTLIPRPLYAAAAKPEVTKAVLGFIALTDASPLIIAKEKGFFAKYGMPDVEVTKQASWGTTRDNLVLGSGGNGIDGAHILTPMPYLITAGKVTQNSVPTPMYILARLNLDSQCISVSNEYADLKLGLDAAPFKIALEKKKAAGQSVKAAMTFPGGTHDCWIRYWLAAGGIDPDKDIETIVVPPPQMVANMKVGTMDCFCVGEPWNEQLKNQKIGYTAVNTAEIWNKHPEKSFAMRADWVDAHPNATKALLMAVQDAQRWCDQPTNRVELAQIVSGRQWFNCPVPDILPRLQGRFEYGTG
ncbi:MAG TPA: CmpA/NrtA family ABC transporter substrate-binding protein, partial [Gammaproteobacteria bacterium]|nr:CmpA/NrtA family ABC transporter substrate-binding protein [Gammaproteobacteria bacterium]